ncbi:MAG: ribosome maturation factor RimM [Burkholderiaceae bacterium]
MPGNENEGFGDNLIELGRIVSAYGLAGWVKIQPYSAQTQVLLKVKSWWLKAPVPALGKTGVSVHSRQCKVLTCRPQGAGLVARLEGLSDRDRAEDMKGHTIWVPRADFPSPDSDEYYWVDLIGCQLFGEDRDGQSRLIGKVADVIDNGAHAVLCVQRTTLDAEGGLIPQKDDKDRFIEVLVPFVGAHVQSVDIVNKRLESNWPVEF